MDTFSTCEREVPDGSVDVSFEKGSVRIACEISVTTPLAHELANVRKCLSGGFGHVLMILPDKWAVGRAASLIQEELSGDDAARVRCLLAEDVTSFLDGVEADAAGLGGQ